MKKSFFQYTKRKNIPNFVLMNIAVYLTWPLWKNSQTKELFLKLLLNNDSSNHFYVWSDSLIDFKDERMSIFEIPSTSFFQKNIFTHKQLSSLRLDLVLNLWENFPIWYKKNVIQLIPTLESIWYPDIEEIQFLKKYSDAYVFKKSLKNAKKIIVFTQKTKKDLNEKLNIEEEKIHILPAFFETLPEAKTSKIDIKTKHALQNDFFIFDDTIWVSKNIKRLLESFQKVIQTQPASVIFLGNEIANDLQTRQYIIDFWLEKQCIFAGTPAENELKNYYTQSVWVISPSLYDHVPFHLKTALSFDTPIFAWNHNEIKNIFWENIVYFSPLSSESISQTLIQALQNTQKTPHYADIKNAFDMNHFTKNLISYYKNIL